MGGAGKNKLTPSQKSSCSKTKLLKLKFFITIGTQAENNNDDLKEKPTIIFIIDSLGRGGAETLLIGILEELSKKFSVVIVTLSAKCEFDENLIVCKEKYSLGVTNNKFSFIYAAYKLGKLIKKHSPVLVHSHLVYRSLLARMVCPAEIPLLFSVHNGLTQNVFDHSRVLSFLEKITIRRDHQTLIAVSNAVLKDYEQTISFKGRKFILENYIEDQFFLNKVIQRKNGHSEMLKIVALGNIKMSKNYEYLLRSFIYLKDLPVSLDIYGKKDHAMFETLQSIISQNDLPVTFKGVATNIPEIFSKYDLYVMSSIHEGFGIAAIEAMACGLPALLSDLPVLREVAFDNAIFFNVENPEALADQIKKILSQEYNLGDFSDKGIEIAKKYTKQNYLERLLAIYKDVLQGTN
jgi:glycosyltransferase involved in cell wall biosynthesis